MLLATAMVAMVAGSLYATLHLAFLAKERALAAVTNIHRGHVAVDIVQSDVLSAVAPSSATATLRGNFIGNAGTTPGSADPNTDILSFYSAAMDIQPAPGIGDLKFIEYICEPTGSGDMNLVPPDHHQPAAAQWHHAHAPPRGRRAGPGEFHGAVFRRPNVVRHLGFLPALRPARHQHAEHALPKAVEIRLEFKGQQGRQGEIVDQTLLIPCGVDQAVIAAQQAAAQMGGGQ